MKRINWIIGTFILIFLLGLFLRLHNLGTVPSGFHQDEVANTYVGKYIFLNGVDLYGNKWPLLYFDKLGDYPPVLPMYISSLGTFIFGDNTFGSRIVIALFSNLIIIPLYIIALWAYKDKRTALFAALLGAITPWLISFARISAEGSIAITLYLFGIMFFIYSLEKKRMNFLIVSFLFLFCTYFIYPGFRIVVPLTLLTSFVFFSRKELKSRSPLIITVFILTAISFIATWYISTTQWGKGRFDQTSIMSAYQHGNNPYNQFIFNEKSILLAHIFDNKIVFFVREFIHQYTLYFSPTYLFITGGSPNWFSVPNTGLLYISCLLLLIVLCIPFFQKYTAKINKKILLFILLLLFIAPIPAALTTELTPHTHRSLLMAPLFILLCSLGFFAIQHIPKRLFWNSLLYTSIAIEFIFFYHNYFQQVSAYTAISRSDANQTAAIYIKNQHQHYKKTYMLATGWFPAYYLYFSDNFDKKLAGTFQINLRIPSVGNVIFVDADCPPTGFHPEKQSLIIFSSTCDASKMVQFHKIYAISAVNHLPVYNVFEN